MADSTSVLSQLDQARELAFSNPAVLPQVVRQILAVAANPDPAIQAWCAKFLRQVFTAAPEQVENTAKTDLAIDSLAAVRTLAATPSLAVFIPAVDVAVVVFKLVFRYVADNDGSSHAWAALSELKNDLVAKFSTQFPFEPSYDREHDMVRNMPGKLALLKFVMTVVDYQLRLALLRYWSVAQVPPGHTLIRPSAMESEALALLEVIIRLALHQDILVVPLVTATLNHLLTVMRRKRQYAETIVGALDVFDALAKMQSNYELLESFKLGKKYVDRTLRVFLAYLTKGLLVPPKFQSSIARKLSQLTAHGDEIRKKNILVPSSDDTNVKKRRFEGFENPATKIQVLDYAHLFSLNNASDLTKFDLSTLPQDILVRIALASLARADVRKLTKALEIVAERYKNALPEEKPVKEEKADSDDEPERVYDPETQYTLPPPKQLLAAQRKETVELIVKNFFEAGVAGAPEEPKAEANGSASENGVSSLLTSVAIKTWHKDLWLVLLTRLATRGMLPDPDSVSDCGDLVRQALFDHFLANIHDRVDLVIEWLNEEWFSEKVAREASARPRIREELVQKIKSGEGDITDLEAQVDAALESEETPTPRYFVWAQKVVDAMIPFLEPTDRKIFLRLLSDLPQLNDLMVGAIRSLCADPARSKLGFLLLQFLMMYRPPAKNACLKVLKELLESSEEDLKAEATKLLEKYGN